MDFRQELVKLLTKETKLKEEEIKGLIAAPPDQKLGDYAFPCFKFGGNPVEKAKQLQKNIKLPLFLSKINVVGPYLNFFINKSILAEETIQTIKKEKKNYGKGRENKVIVLEYCGPNTNKPLHLGHIRNMSLGHSLCQLLSFQGNKVHPVNIVNDRGIHICQSMLAYQKWGNKKKPDKKGDHFVGDFYVKFAQGLAKNKDLKDEAQDLLSKWESKDKETLTLWKKMNKWVLDGFKETYDRFGISFEKEYFESDYYEKGKDLAWEGFKKGIFEKDATNALVAPLEKYNLPPKIVLRGDGTSIYITQDMYLADQRFHDFKFDQLIYVVASEQQLHFKQLFKVLELLKRPYASKLFHLSYGLVNLPSGRMKSREGTVVDADNVMDELSALAEKEVRKRHKDLSPAKIKQRAEFIGLAAIKFFMLHTDATRDIIFNPEESLSFEGETGPYLQYSHARACSILRKAGMIKGKINFELLNQDQEQKTILLLSQFPSIVQEATEHYRVHILCHYLIELAQSFNEFYHALPVISEDKELMKARLSLVEAVKQVLARGLNLSGIYAPEEM